MLCHVGYCGFFLGGCGCHGIRRVISRGIGGWVGLVGRVIQWP